jgi:Glycosyl transferase family 2
MPLGPLSEFREAAANGDAFKLAAYLKKTFPSDHNISYFDALAELVSGLRAEFPSNLAVDARDRHFVESMMRVTLGRPLGADAAPPRQIIEVGPDLDFLEDTCHPHRLSALQMLCVAMHLRQPVRKRVAVVSMVRDEGIYLPEWLAHYRLIGVDHVFVYTNDNSDGSEVLLRELALAGSITLINNIVAPGVNPQRKGYQHAILLLDELRDYRWALFVDADEFLNFRNDNAGALPAFIDKVEQQFSSCLPGGVIFPWNWRFTDRAFMREEISVLGKYPHASLHKMVKSLINLRDTLAMCEVHIPTLDENGLLVDGEMRRVVDAWQGVQRPYAGPVVEHFWSKSFTEFLIKKRRGDHLALEGKQFMREFSQFFAWTGIPTESNFLPISDTWIEKVKAGAEEVLSNSAIAEAYRVVVERYRQHVAEASEDDLGSKLYGELLQSIVPIMS